MGQVKNNNQQEKSQRVQEQGKTVEVQTRYTTSKKLRTSAEEFLTKQFLYPNAWMSDVGEDYARFLTLVATDITTQQIIILDHRGHGSEVVQNEVLTTPIESDESD